MGCTAQFALVLVADLLQSDQYNFFTKTFKGKTEITS